MQTDSRDFFGGAPPAGTCVAHCDAQAGCSAFAGAVCVDVSDPARSDAGTATPGLCFQSCTIGDDSSQKCDGRAGIACAPIEGASGHAAYCRPTCASGTECPSGACDPSRGVCTTMAEPDSTFGGSCPTGADGGPSVDGGEPADSTTDASTPDAEANVADGAGEAGGSLECQGVCIELPAAPSVCSRRCVFGSTGECAPTSAGPRRSGCLFVTTGGTIGDLGYCAELCDCSGDCTDPSAVCDAFDDSSLENAFGRQGVCTAPALVVKRVLNCIDP